MRKFILLTALISGSAFAEGEAVFNYTFFGNTSGRYTMVACSYAEDAVADYMGKFGAKSVDVNCSGGITPSGVFPLNLRVTYTPADVGGATRVEKVKIESGTFPGDSNCDFDTSLIGALVRDFPNVAVESRRDGCFRNDSPYSYLFSVTLPR